jgi:hypothetical protein
MLDAYHLMKVAQNVKLFVIKVAKCKKSSILTSIQNTQSISVLTAKMQQEKNVVQIIGE